MEKIFKFGRLVVLPLLFLAGMGSCKIEVVDDPVSLNIARNGVTIVYTGNYSSNDAGDAKLTVVNNINSDIYSMYAIWDNSGYNMESSDLLGSYCIGRGNTNTIQGVPLAATDIRVHFADSITYTALFTGLDFYTHDFELTIDIDTSSGTVIPFDLPVNPGIANGPMQNQNSEQPVDDGTRFLVKDGKLYSLRAVPR